MELSDIFEGMESIGFNVTSEKAEFAVFSLEDTVADYCENFDPVDKYFTNFTVEVFAAGDCRSNIGTIGFLKGTSIESEMCIEEEFGFLELCDMASGELLRMAEAIIDADGCVDERICPPDRNIMYIDKIYIEENCRSFGVGRYLLDNVNDIFNRVFNYRHYVCIVKPFPQIKRGNYVEDLKEATSKQHERLNNFYKRAGYQEVDNTGFLHKIQPDPYGFLFESEE